MPPAKSDTPGVEVHGDKVRIYFRWQGKLCREPTGWPATTASLKRASKLRKRIVDEIRVGTFDYARHFPGSPRAGRSGMELFGDVAERWLERVRPNLEPSTLKGYVKKINRYWMPALADRSINQITSGELMDIAAEIDVSGKTFNDSLTPLRQVLEHAVADGLIEENPAKALKTRKHQRPPPDPLTAAEMALVLDTIRESDQWAPWWPYFAMAFGTGARPSELFALTHGDIDYQSGYVSIERAWVEQRIKGTKTHETRRVELSSLAKAGLAALPPGAARDLLFLNPGTGEQIHNDKPPRLVWTDALNAAGIRHRPAYNCRHTFATLAITSGCNPVWLSRQLGHKNATITFKHYAKWIDQVGSDRQVSALDNAFATAAPAHSFGNILGNTGTSERSGKTVKH